MKKSKLTKSIVAVIAIAALAMPVSVLGAEWTLEKDQRVEQPKPYSPCVDQHFPRQVLFGHTHFHSSFSVDSGLIGNTLDLETAAYRRRSRSC